MLNAEAHNVVVPGDIVFDDTAESFPGFDILYSSVIDNSPKKELGLSLNWS